jgi:acylphosphatase
LFVAGDSANATRRFFVSGSVQGVGFRYFTQRAAERLRLSGYVRNLGDGRVEVLASGAAGQLAALKSELERGPRGAFVSGVVEEPATLEARYAGAFVVEFTSR